MTSNVVICSDGTGNTFDRSGKVRLHASVGAGHGIAEPVAQLPPSCI
jgi:hypothetical protein